MIVRKATEKDLEFIAEAILAADKGAGNKLSYENIFSLSEDEFVSALPSILEEDIEGQELCISGFAIAEIDGEPAAACCAWIEGEEQPANSIKMTVLGYFFPKEKLQFRDGVSEALRQMQIARTPGTVQLESVYVKKEHRGKGIIKQLFDFQLATHASDQAEIMLTEENTAAAKAYENYGFRIKEQKHCSNAVLPFSGMILMER